MKRNGSGESAVDGLDGLLQAVALALDDFHALATILQVETTDRQSGHRMHRLSTEARLVQRMLHDGAIQARERVAIEMRGLAVDTPTANSV